MAAPVRREQIDGMFQLSTKAERAARRREHFRGELPGVGIGGFEGPNGGEGTLEMEGLYPDELNQ